MSATIDKSKLLVEIGDLRGTREIGSQEWRTLGDAWLVIAKANQIDTTPIRPDIEAISARCDAATPGPWTTESTHQKEAADVTHGDNGWVCDVFTGTGPNGIVAKAIAESGFDADIHLRNAVFIAAARTDVPTLILEVRRLTAAGNDLCAMVEAREAEIEQFRRAIKVAEDKIAAVDARLAAMQARMPL